MTSGSRAKAATIASDEGRAMAIILVLCSAVAAVAPLFDQAHWWVWAKHIPLVPALAADMAVFAVASAWVLYRGFRLGVRFDDHGVTVCRIVKTDRYAWPGVSRFADGCYKTGHGETIWALDVVLVDGQAITLTATARKKRNPKMLTAISEVAARYQIPAELTGTPQTRDGSPTNPGLYPDPGGAPGLREWDGREWSPLQADPARGRTDAGKPAEVWSPLPGSEQQWHAAAQARRAGTWAAVWLLVTVAVLVVVVVLYARDLSQPHADYSLAELLVFVAAPTGLLFTSAMWHAHKENRRIDRAGKMAAGSAATGGRHSRPNR